MVSLPSIQYSVANYGLCISTAPELTTFDKWNLILSSFCYFCFLSAPVVRKSLNPKCFPGCREITPFFPEQGLLIEFWWLASVKVKLRLGIAQLCCCPQARTWVRFSGFSAGSSLWRHIEELGLPTPSPEVTHSILGGGKCWKGKELQQWGPSDGEL